MHSPHHFIFLFNADIHKRKSGSPFTIFGGFHLGSEVNTRPKNFAQMLAVAKELLRCMVESDEKSWRGEYEAIWSAKLSELADLVFKNEYLADYLSFEDLREVFFQIVLYTGKHVKDITNEDLESLLDKLLTNPETYHFFFPAIDLFNFPKEYALGVCVLGSFLELPENAQTYISSTWEFEYDDDKTAYRVRSVEEYKEAKKKETYFCLQVIALGFYRAVDKATKLANQALKILKCFYMLEDFLPPNLGRCYYLGSRGGQGGQRPIPSPTETRRVQSQDLS